MNFFIDTSAFLAILDADDENQQKARKKWEELISQNAVLVCCVSFDIMRQLGIKSLFAFDRHFKEQGFECIP